MGYILTVYCSEKGRVELRRDFSSLLSHLSISSSSRMDPKVPRRGTLTDGHGGEPGRSQPAGAGPHVPITVHPRTRPTLLFSRWKHRGLRGKGTFPPSPYWSRMEPEHNPSSLAPNPVRLHLHPKGFSGQRGCGNSGLGQLKKQNKNPTAGLVRDFTMLIDCGSSRKGDGISPDDLAMSSPL